MPDQLNSDFSFRRMRDRLDDPYVKHAIVILVDQNGEVETAARGVRNDVELFKIVHHVATGLADELIPKIAPIQTEHGPMIIVPRGRR